jgi:hypothetical protein
MIKYLQEEERNWHQYGFDEVCIVPLGGEQPALVMPYGRHLKEEEFKEPLKKKAIEEAAREMIEHGLCHNDVHRRHVCLISPMYLG